MLKQIFHGQSTTVTGAAIIISAATLLSRGVGLLRDRIFAHYFGAGPLMDAYYAAFKLPDLVYNLLIVGALTAGFIPTFTRLFYQRDDKGPAWRLANNILNITAAALLAVSAVGILFAPVFVPLIAPGFSAETRSLTIQLTRIMFGSTLLLGLSMVVGGILQSLRSFVLYSLAPVLYNLGIIIGAVGLVPLLGPTGLAWGVVLGAVLHFSLQMYSAHVHGYRWHKVWNFKDADTRLIGKLMIPRTLGLAIHQIHLVVITVLASLLPAGSVTIFNFANNLQAVPVGIIGIPFALAVFPLLSEAVSQKDGKSYLRNLSSTARQILFLIIPLSIVILLLRAQIVRVVLGTGEFDWTATIHTANALALFALSLFAQALIPLFARAFYALTNTKTPFVIGVISELISIIASLILMKPLGVAGLALAFSIGSILNCVMLIVALRQQLTTIDGQRLLTSLFKISLAALAMGLTIQYLKYPLAQIVDQQYFWGILAQGMGAGVAGLIVYGIICYLLRLEEMLHFQAAFRRRWLRLWSVGEGIDEAEKL